MPEALYGRAADNWRPLIAIADPAGGAWPVRARQVAEGYGGRHDDLAPVMLLADIAAMFEEKPGLELHKSEEITEALNRMEHRPWPEWRNGKPMTARQLAKLLEAKMPLRRYDPSETAVFDEAMPLQPPTTVTATSETKSQKVNGGSGVADKTPPKAILGDVGIEAAVAFEERAAILEYDVGLSRAEAEAVAAAEMPDIPAFLDRRVGVRRGSASKSEDW